MASIPRTDAVSLEIVGSRVWLTVMICAAVFLSCMNLNLEAPLYDRGYGTNDLNMARDADTVNTIVNAWRGRPITETQMESRVVPDAVHYLTVASSVPAQPGNTTTEDAPAPVSYGEMEREQNLVPRAERSYEIDGAFIATYFIGFLLAIVALVRFTPAWLDRWNILSILTFLAAACDIMENYFSLRNLQGHPVTLVYPLTIAKFVCFFTVLALLLVIALLRGAPWRTNGPEVLRAFYHLRVPILIQLGLVAIAYFDATSPGVAAMTRGIFDVEGWKRTMLVTAICLLLSWSAMILCRIILAYGPARFGVRAIPSLQVTGSMNWETLAVWSLPAWLPIARAVGVAEDYKSAWLKLPFVACGVVLALFVLIVADIFRLHERAPGPGQPHAFALPFPQSPALISWRTTLLGASPWFGNRPWFRGLFKAMGPGFTDGLGNVGSGHVLAVCAVAVLLVMSLVTGFFLGPGGGRGEVLSVLWFVVVFAGSLLWMGAFLTFWFDRFLVPLLLSVVIVLSGAGLIFDTDHYFATIPMGHADSRSEYPAKVFSDWLAKHPDKNEPIVVVAAAGGGIQAGAWTAKVLTSLERAMAAKTCGSDFRSSILLMSSVSGGSVGVMYYADSFVQAPNSAALPRSEGKKVVSLAERSSLAEVAWGIAYPDFPLLRLLMPKTLDRAWAMQTQWGRGWAGNDRKLSEWKTALQKQEQPAVILNSTIVESGQRFELTNFDTPTTTASSSLSFDSTFPQCDLPVLTAARLSATFPWVSPVSRPLKPESCGSKRKFHLADGGYYDNLGVDSAVEWFNEAGVSQKSDLHGHKLIWIEIRAFPDATPPTNDKKWGWFQQSIAPIDGMLEVRTTSQKDHDKLERDEFLEKFGDEAKPFAFVFQGSNPPLSWHLLHSQQRSIEHTWYDWYVKPKDNAYHGLQAEFCRGDGSK